MIRILFLVLMISLVSCVEVDETPEMVVYTPLELIENPLLGKWFSVTRELDGCIDSSMNITEIFHPIECTTNDNTECKYQEIEFRQGVMRMRNRVKFEGNVLDDYDEIEYEIYEDVIRLCFGRLCESYSYTLENNLLRISIENDQFGCSDTWVLRHI